METECDRRGVGEVWRLIRIRTLLLGTIVLLALLAAACTSRPEGENGETAEQAERVSEEPYVMTTVGAITPDMVFKYGETLENNVHLRWAEQRLGIRIQYLWTVPSSQFDTKMRLELAAKRDVPDVIATRSTIIQELIDSGEFREVGSLFDMYASATWKKAMNENRDVWEAFTRDGQRYAIPILDYEYHSDPVLWIRTDWLRQVGMEPPETLDELEAVMRAFTFGDPDGNGRHDTAALATALGTGVSARVGDSTWIFGMFGTVPAQWNIGEDGRLVYGSVHPGAKRALAVMRDWLAQGFIPAEAELMDGTAAQEAFIQGKVGMIAGPHWMVYWPFGDMTGAEFRAIPLPAGPDGHVARRGSLPRNGAILISKRMEKPEYFFKYQNFLFDTYALREGELKYGLAENYDWSYADGRPTTDPRRVPGGYVRVANYTLTYDGARIPSRWRTEGQPNTVEVLLAQKDASWIDQYQGAPTPTQREKGELLRKLEEETFRQIIYGRLPLDAFDDFVNRWTEHGGRRITEEVNAWRDGRQP